MRIRHSLPLRWWKSVASFEMPSNSGKYGPLGSLISWLVQSEASINDRIKELFAYANDRSPSMFTAYHTHMPLNRYDDFMCYDRNRITLIDGGQPYIHGNEIQLPNGIRYVMTQAPLPHTVIDFWRMVCQVKPYVIVALNEPASADEQFAPSSLKEVKCSPLYAIRGRSVQSTEKWINVETTLSMKNAPVGTVRYLLLKWWTQDKIPPRVSELISFARLMRKESDAMHVQMVGSKRVEIKRQPPVVLVCPTGAIRCGLMAAADAITRMMDTEKMELDIQSLIKAMRNNRYGTINTFDQYIYVYMLMAEAAREKGIPRADLALERLRRLYESRKNQ